MSVLLPPQRRPVVSRLRVFLFTLTVKPMAGDDRLGRQPMLVLVSAPTVDDATERGENKLYALGWREVELDGLKELTEADQREADPLFQEALARVRETGFANITY